MKTPQRQFVVEFKSGRRRSTTRPDSIWGNTDLKAFAREVETAAPHLFASPAVSETQDQDGEGLTEPRPQKHLSDNNHSFDEKQISASPFKAEQPYLPQPVDGLTSGSSPQLKDGNSRRRLPTKTQSRSKAVANNPGKKRLSSMQSTAAHLEAPTDELVALEEENLQLKGLMVKHLLQQNNQLRMMLGRFGIF